MIRNEFQCLERVVGGMAAGIISKIQCKSESGESIGPINVRKDDSSNRSRWVRVEARLFAAIFENLPSFYRHQDVMSAPQMEIRTVPCPLCPLCGGQGSLLHPHMQDRMFAIPGNWPLRQCSSPDCGLCWLDPGPVESEIPRFYTNYFTHERGDLSQPFLRPWYSLLYTGYRFATYMPSACLGLNKARHQIQHMFLEDMKPGKLLDVGCGNGVFLRRMRRLGWSGTGIDFDAKAIENATKLHGDGLTFMNTDLSGARFPDNSFHAVTMSHVIEHIPDPVGLLVESRRILKQGGRLVVTTPNVRSFGHQKFQDCWSGLDSPRHLRIFSLSALQKCARQAGFNTMKASTSAANADGLIAISLGFEQAKATLSSYQMKIQFNFIRGLRSLMLQYVELRQMRHDAECGEEAILICEK